MKRGLFLFYAILFLSSCNHQKEDIVIKLHTANGYGVFSTGRVILGPIDDSLYYKGVPDEIQEYVVRRKIMQFFQYFWSKYKNGDIDSALFDKYYSYYKFDTTKLTNEIVDSEILFLIGTKNNGKRVIIVDSNNDEDFSGEKVLEYEYPVSLEKEKELDSLLQVVTVKYDYFYNGEVIFREVEISPSPYKGSLGVQFHTDNEIEKKYFLFVSLPKYKIGGAKLNKTEFDIYISNGFTSEVYSKKNVEIFLAPEYSKELPSEKGGDISYQIGDIYNVNGQDFLIESISYWGDTLNLKYLGDNNHPEGLSEGFYLPKFKAQQLDNIVFTLDNYPDKYILFDFWGTWCNPCIKSIPDIRSLYKDFSSKSFILVSVAYDRDRRAVIDFVNKESMDWVHVFVDQNVEDGNSLVSKLKVHSFPTTILIDPDHKIIARDKKVDELRKILNKALAN